MSDHPTTQVVKAGVSVALVICGVLFIALWLCGAAALGMMKLMASLMANDSGAASSEAHMTLIFGMMGGQLLTGLAGIPAELAFFWRGWRKRLLWTFLIMLVVGILIQAAAFFKFFPA
ncbi:MAG: hypothetical protein ACKVY0_09665 [Prosthecobacter sp.]|uniref:hypothetical protein n=1 Tax=Prosthecobacter sp. TaxID=1965333 RepID=UPI00390100D1